MSNQSAKILYSSSTTTAAAGTSTAADTIHEIILTMKACGLALNAATLAIVRSWLAQGLTLDCILEYVIPETAIAPQPSIRYAAAIASRCIRQGLFTLEAARASKRPQKTAPQGCLQTDYEQRTYEERKPNQLPQWLREMMEEEQNQAHS